MTVAPEEAEGWMRRCLELARGARERGDAPVGAVVVRGGRIIGEGAERVKAARDIAGHAELLAIQGACESLGTLDLSGCVLVTTAEPCWMCSYAVREAGVSAVVIGLPVSEIGGATSCHPILTDADIKGWGPPPALLWGILAGECGV